MDSAYYYPEASGQLAEVIYSRFVDLGLVSLESRPFAAMVTTAAGYDVGYHTHDLVHQVIQKLTTHSVINVDNDQMRIEDIPENDHLLYLSDRAGKEVILPFIQNKEKQMTNSFTFYLSPVYKSDRASESTYANHTIACLMIKIIWFR